MLPICLSFSYTSKQKYPEGLAARITQRQELHHRQNGGKVFQFDPKYVLSRSSTNLFISIRFRFSAMHVIHNPHIINRTFVTQL